MNWDENLGAPTLVGGVPIVRAASISVGDYVSLRKGNVQYKVRVFEADDDNLSGRVQNIDCTEDQQTIYYKIGDTVKFTTSNVFIISF